MAERRTAAKLIRFRPDEIARVTERAHACGRTPACFIRETALGAIPRPRHDAAADPLLCELGRIGRCLDQLARRAEAGGSGALATEVRAAFERHWVLVRQLVKNRRRRTAGVAG